MDRFKFKLVPIYPIQHTKWLAEEGGRREERIPSVRFEPRCSPSPDGRARRPEKARAEVVGGEGEEAVYAVAAGPCSPAAAWRGGGGGGGEGWG